MFEGQITQQCLSEHSGVPTLGTVSFKKKLLNIQWGSICFYFDVCNLETKYEENKQFFQEETLKKCDGNLIRDKAKDCDETLGDQGREAGKCGRSLGYQCEDCSAVCPALYLICARRL